LRGRQCYNVKTNYYSMKALLIIRSINGFLHDKYGVVVMFLLISVSLLLACLYLEYRWVILLPVLLIFIYDLLFRFSYKDEWAERGRDYNSTLNGIRAAIQYTSILIGFIGIVLSGFFEINLITALKAKLASSFLLKTYAFTLVVIPTLMLLFIPVTYTQTKITEKKSDEKSMIEPSIALKNYYFLILLLQKVLIILSVYMAFVVFDIYMKMNR